MIDGTVKMHMMIRCVWANESLESNIESKLAWPARRKFALVEYGVRRSFIVNHNAEDDDKPAA